MGLALAAPPASLPGRALVLAPCEVDPAAPCWAQAPRLLRFAAPPGLAAEPVEAEVRLAREGDRVLVWSRGLAPGQELELGFVEAPGEDLPGVRALRVQPVAGGVVRSEPTPLLSTPGLLGLRVQLLDEAGNARPWAPSGPGDALGAFPVAVAAQPALGFPLEVRRTRKGVVVTAPAASEVVAVAEAPVLRRPNRGVPPPWQVEGIDRLGPLSPPESGWVEITATWQDEDGLIADVQRRRTWVEGAASSVPVARWTPTPAVLEPLKGRPWRPAPGLHLITQEPLSGPAGTLAAALEHRLGLTATVAPDGTPQPGDIVLTRTSVGQDEAALEGRARDEAWQLTVREGVLRIEAPGPTGLRHGVSALLAALPESGELQPVRVVDAPVLPLRALYHRRRLSTASLLPGWDEALARLAELGRFDTVVVDPADTLADLGGTAALEEDLARLAGLGRRQGFEVAPAISVPAHAEWLLRTHPELAEGVSGSMICTRHPGTTAFLAEHLDHLLALTPEASLVHLGMDEALWPTAGFMGDERCPRCAGSPRPELLARFLQQQVQAVADRDRRALVWSDTFVAGWNGGAQGGAHALDGFPEELADDVVFVSWSRVGDTLGSLGQRFSVIRGDTGLLPWRRPGLGEVSDRLEGALVALFQPDPTSAFGPAPGSRGLPHHWSRAVVGGWSAWQPALAEVPLARLLARLLDSPGPGHRRVGDLSTALPAAISGPVPGPLWPGVSLPRQVDLGEARFQPLRPVAARAGEPARIEVGGRRLAGISLLVSAELGRDAARILRRKLLSEGHPPLVATLQLQGTRRSLGPSLRYGRQVFSAAPGAEAVPMWEAAGGVLLPGLEAAAIGATATDRQLIRVDLALPDSAGPLEHIEVEVSLEDAELVIYGALLIPD